MITARVVTGGINRAARFLMFYVFYAGFLGIFRLTVNGILPLISWTTCARVTDYAELLCVIGDCETVKWAYGR